MNIGKFAKIPFKKQTLTYLLGVCVPCNKHNAAKIRIRRLEFDDYLSMVRKCSMCNSEYSIKVI